MLVRLSTVALSLFALVAVTAKNDEHPDPSAADSTATSHRESKLAAFANNLRKIHMQHSHSGSATLHKKRQLNTIGQSCTSSNNCMNMEYCDFSNSYSNGRRLFGAPTSSAPSGVCAAPSPSPPPPPPTYVPMPFTNSIDTITSNGELQAAQMSWTLSWSSYWSMFGGATYEWSLTAISITANDGNSWEHILGAPRFSRPTGPLERVLDNCPPHPPLTALPLLLSPCRRLLLQA